MSIASRISATIASLIVGVTGLFVLTLGSASSVADTDWNSPRPGSTSTVYDCDWNTPC